MSADETAWASCSGLPRTETLKEAVERFEAYMKEYDESIYCIGSVVGPHPFPADGPETFQMVVALKPGSSPGDDRT